MTGEEMNLTDWQREMFRRLRDICKRHVEGSDDINEADDIIDELQATISTLRGGGAPSRA